MRRPPRPPVALAEMADDDDGQADEAEYGREADAGEQSDGGVAVFHACVRVSGTPFRNAARASSSEHLLWEALRNAGLGDPFTSDTVAAR